MRRARADRTTETLMGSGAATAADLNTHIYTAPNVEADDDRVHDDVLSFVLEATNSDRTVDSYSDRPLRKKNRQLEQCSRIPPSRRHQSLSNGRPKRSSFFPIFFRFVGDGIQNGHLTIIVMRHQRSPPTMENRSSR
jgi:hypothetical protein